MCNRDRTSYCKLHQAIVENSFETIYHLLQKSTNSINCIALSWGTPLLMSLHKNAPDNIIICLLEAGSNPNATYRGNSALHFAIGRPNIALALLKAGANPNLLDRFNCTPLHHAVDNNDLEMACMLLCFGANASVRSLSGVTPVDTALIERNFDIAASIIHFSTYDDVNYNFHDYNNTEHILLLEQNDPALFKLYWAKVNHHALYKKFPDFLVVFFERCNFDTENWVECMLLILTSEVAFELIERFNLIEESTCKVPNCTFLFSLIIKMKKKKIEWKQRLFLLNATFTLGIQGCFHGFDLLQDLFGFGRELEAMIYCTNYSATISMYPEASFEFPRSALVLAVSRTEFERNPMWVEQNPVMIIFYFWKPFWFTLDTLGFFAIPHLVKCHLYAWCKITAAQDNHEENVESERRANVPQALQGVPIMPSLLELSRDAVRRVIRLSGGVEHPYQFHDIVKGLEVPHSVKDFVRFKRAIY